METETRAIASPVVGFIEKSICQEVLGLHLGVIDRAPDAKARS